MTEEEFWQLSWWDWGLYTLRSKKQFMLRKAASEDAWARTRELWAVMINQWKKAGSAATRPQELIKLSFDKDDPLEVPVVHEPEEAFKRFGGVMKRENGTHAK